MPDLQSELGKIAQEWDTHESEIRQAPAKFKTTGNATKDTFDFIRVNHNTYTQQRAAIALAELGYKKPSIQAVLTQMKLSGMLAVDVDGRLYTTQDAYTPLTNPYHKPKEKRKVGRPKKVAGAGIAALPVAEKKVVAAAVERPALTAADVLSKLSVSEAFELYRELQTYFKGA